MSISLAIGLGVNMGGGPGFTPALLFAGGKKGVWYDPSDFGTMFQDSAGTIPAAVGQPVGLLLDKSGNGNHATQGTSANRPTLQVDGNGRYYLAFNGTNSGMVTSSIDFTGTAQMTVFVGLRKLSDIVAVIAEYSPSSGSNPGSFGLFQYSAPNQFASRLQGSVANYLETTINDVAAPKSHVLTQKLDMTIATSLGADILRVDGAIPTQTSAGTAVPPVGGNFGTYALNIGARSVALTPSLFFNGNLYGLCVVGKTASAAEIASTESYINGKTGAY